MCKRWDGIRTYFSIDEDDLFDVMDIVIHIKARYYHLGIALKLRLSELRAIQSTYERHADQALSEVVVLWLQQKYNFEKFGPPTWRQLVIAIDSEAGGDSHALAKKVASKYSSGKHTTTPMSVII